MINDLPALLVQDQLAQEQALGLTLHHLREGTITFKVRLSFPLPP
jgi:hypothetical protein